MIRNKEEREKARIAGLERFTVGVPCKNGHVSERYVSDGKCVACVLEGKKNRHARNPEKRSATDRAYYAKNKESFSKKNKTYYENNKENIAENGAAYREANRESIRETQRKRYESNSGKLRAKGSEVRAMRANRSIDWGEEYSALTRKKERELHDLCVELKQMVGEAYSMDHMIPLMGKLVCGLHVPNNLQVIPETLNRMKINKFVLTEENEWRRAAVDLSVLREPEWYRESVDFYTSLGWDFKNGCYTSGPYLTNR